MFGIIFMCSWNNIADLQLCEPMLSSSRIFCSRRWDDGIAINLHACQCLNLHKRALALAANIWPLPTSRAATQIRVLTVATCFPHFQLAAIQHVSFIMHACLHACILSCKREALHLLSMGVS